MSIGRLFFLVALLPIGCSAISVSERLEEQGELRVSDMDWAVVNRGVIDGCEINDHFRQPTLKNRLCVSHVERHVNCQSGSPLVSSLSWIAAKPRHGECSAISNPGRAFLPATVVQGWNDAPELLHGLERLLDRLPDEYEEHHLTEVQATALSAEGLSALLSIDYSPSETFGPETLRLLFHAEGWNYYFVLLMDQRHPLKKYTWGILVE